MSGHEQSFAVEAEQWRTMLGVQRWELERVDAYAQGILAERLAEGWEPFAVAHHQVWLRRQSWSTPFPLPPQ